MGEGVTALSHRQNRLGNEGEDLLILSDKVSDIRVTLSARLGAPISKDEYDLKRFAAGFAEFPTEINDSLILTEGGLREAVSFQKGCYVGQEVIERSDALGKLPRHLERIVFDGCEAVPLQAVVVGREEKPIGKVVSVISDTANKRVCAFAMLKTGAYTAYEEVQCEGVRGKIISSEDSKV
jgi:folate-binding protein YgfZ